MAEKGKCQVCSKLSDSRCSWCRVVFYCCKEHQKQDWETHKGNCTKKKYTIDQDEKLGRHLLASEDIKGDYILLKDKALLLSIKANSLDFTPHKICLGCYKEIKDESSMLLEEDPESESLSSSSSASSEEKSDTSSTTNNTNSNANTNANFSGGKICEKCSLPICSPECSAQYFHKNFECRLISETTLINDSFILDVQGNDSAKKGTASSRNKLGEQRNTRRAIASSPASGSSSASSIRPKTPQGLPSSPPTISTSFPASGTKTPSSPSPSIPSKIDSEIRSTIVKNLIYFRAILLQHANPKGWNEMMLLQSDEERRRDQPNLERTTRVFTILKNTLAQIHHPTINHVYKPDVHKILGILDLNSLHFSISSPSAAPDLELSALFPNFSLLQHSCVPNVRYYLVPLSPPKNKYLFELYCRSSVKIKKGDNLSVSHVNLMWNTDKRREFLKKERGFWCQCARCIDPYELGSNFSTLLCPQETCPGLSVPVQKSPDNPTEIHWKCNKCSKYIQPWQVKKVDNRLCEMVAKAQPGLKSYKDLLARIEQLVHPDYYLSFVVNHSLIQMYCCEEEGEVQPGRERNGNPVHDKAALEEKVALSNRLIHIIKKLDPGLAKLNIYTAVIYYEMQSAILSMVGAEVDDDFKILRHKPETVKLAKVYLQKCIDCFKYEFLDLPENKLKNLAHKKMEYLDFILRARHDLS